MDQNSPPIANISERLSQWLHPLLESFAFKRLENVTFLGILSPRFSSLPNFPFKPMDGDVTFDGTRADHSIGVAILLMEIAKALRLSERTKKYGLAWAVLHDVATWPLSHTGEAAFSDITGTTANSLRESMIVGSNDLPPYLTIKSELDELRIDQGLLLSLYEKSHNAMSGELSILWKIVNSPLTPDTIEGMHRSGRVFRIDTPQPKKITASFVSDLFSDAFIESRKSTAVLQFWRAKSRIYRSFINSKKAIDFESKWALAIEESFQHISLPESLLLPENCILSSAASHLRKRPRSQKRYKAPLDYYINRSHAGKRRFKRHYDLDDLAEVLEKTRKSVP